MSLIKDFYTINNIAKPEPQRASATIALNAEHPIFDGHFPEQPVVPGVCQIQILTEVAGNVLDRKLQLQSSSVTKFLAMIDPNKTPNLELSLEFKTLTEGAVALSGQLFFEETIFLKFKGNFK